MDSNCDSHGVYLHLGFAALEAGFTRSKIQLIFYLRISVLFQSVYCHLLF